MPARTGRAACVLLLVAVAISCSPPSGPPDLVIMSSGGVTLRFADQEWDAYGSTDMRVSSVDLVPVGTAQRADPTVFPDATVYRIRAFDPTKILAMIDRSVPAHPEIVVFAPAGHSPANDSDLCPRLYRTAASICPSLPSSTP